MRAIDEKTQATGHVCIAYRNFFPLRSFVVCSCSHWKARRSPFLARTNIPGYEAKEKLSWTIGSSLHAYSRNRRNCGKLKGLHLWRHKEFFRYQSMENGKVILGLLWTSKKTFSRPEMLLRLENYESLDHRLRFPWKVHEKVILQRGGFRPLCEASPWTRLRSTSFSRKFKLAKRITGQIILNTNPLSLFNKALIIKALLKLCQ